MTMKRMTKQERDDQYLAKTLFVHGDEIMEGLGMTRDEHFQWSDADLDWVWDMAKKHGVKWLYNEGPAARRSGSARI